MLRFFSRRRAEQEAADRIYAAAAEASRNPVLFREYGMPDTLQGRFESMALHLFPVLHRLMHDPGDDPHLARLASERFVAHMDDGFREMGMGDAAVPKQMKVLYRSFAGRIAAYKRATEEGEGALAAAISRNIFPEGGGERHALALARYLKAATERVRDASLDDLRRGAVPFPRPLPVGSEVDA